MPQRSIHQILDLQNEEELTRLFPVNLREESHSFRTQRRSVLIAEYVIDESGELSDEKVDHVLKELEHSHPLYAFSPSAELVLQRHVKILKMVKNPSFWRRITHVQRPLCHRQAEEVIRNTVGGAGRVLEKDIRRAVLSSCLTLLRQNVGSCFATAPAILIHADQVEGLVGDLGELLVTGKLKRTFGGVEHVVPMSPNAGTGRIEVGGSILLTDHPLLKTWEFTLASFSEIKMEFSKWNLYGSLGFDPREPGGLGEVVYRYLQEQVEESQKKIEDMHAQYALAYDQLRSTEILLRGASSESEVRRLKLEHQSRSHHMHACLDLRNQIHDRAAHYGMFFDFLIERYRDKFPEYFQEIYDAEMKEVRGSAYDDSPAGFRLIYKYGRSDASVWKLIYHADEWIEALVDFFRAVEPEMIAQCESEGAKQDVGLLTTEILHHLRRKEFLKGALLRAAKSHQGGGNTPWAYLSGGTMDILVTTYYRREAPLSREERHVESPMDLLIFLLDTMKGLPPRAMASKMLMQSPTHAFVLEPFWELFKEGWEDRGFTYTWVRDHFVQPREQYYEKIVLNVEQQQFLVEQFASQLNPLEGHRLRKNISFLSPLSVSELRESVLRGYEESALWDGFIYQTLPIVSREQAGHFLREWVGGEVDDLSGKGFLTRHELEKLARQRLAQIDPQVDSWNEISKRSSVRGFAPPPPLLFADTNWAGFYFGFVVNPGTGALELWRMDRSGCRGFPMTSWKAFIDGSSRLKWIIYTHAHEYSLKH